MRIDPDKWLAEYEASLAEAHEPPLQDHEREGIGRVLGWFAKMDEGYQAEAIRCFVICAIRGCADVARALSRADAWIESAELSADPDFDPETMRQASGKTYEELFEGIEGEEPTSAAEMVRDYREGRG